METVMEESKAPKIFISYSWKKYKDEVEMLARRLMSDGIEVVLDIWDLKEGHDKYIFMESMVADPSISKVLIICDQSYAEKANSRSGGVGDETAIISSEVYEKTLQEKFIPVVFETDENDKAYMPIYLKSRIFILLPQENEEAYEKLLRNLHGEPLSVKPPVGKKPDYISNPSINMSAVANITKQINSCSANNTNKITFTAKNGATQIAEALLQFKIQEEKNYSKAVIDTLDDTLPLRNYTLEFFLSIIEKVDHSGDLIADIFETIYNIVNENLRVISFENRIQNFWISEVFIAVNAMLLYYNKYEQINELLTYSYSPTVLVSENSTHTENEPTNYSVFNYYSKMIGHCYNEVKGEKSNNPTSVILRNRQQKPYLTDRAIIETDLFLYHMMILLYNGTIRSYSRWYPMTFSERTFVHYKYNMIIWQKLKSKNHCKKVCKLLGVDRIEDIKLLMTSHKETDNNSHYTPPAITSFIKIEDIGTIP
jgi:hypothetical protein